jgi:hypothetical protein
MGFFNMMAMGTPIPEGVYDGTLGPVGAAMVVLLLAMAGLAFWRGRSRKQGAAARRLTLAHPAAWGIAH